MNRLSPLRIITRAKVIRFHQLHSRNHKSVFGRVPYNEQTHTSSCRLRLVLMRLVLVPLSGASYRSNAHEAVLNTLVLFVPVLL
jgi:hypothetical protein